MANTSFLQQMLKTQISNGQANALKERLVRQMKMIYVLETILPTYTCELRNTYNQMCKLGMNQNALGDLGDALKQMSEAEKIYTMAHDKLMKVWEYGENKEEINTFIQNTYNTLSDMIENACRCTPEGHFKKDFQYLAFIPQEDMKSLDKWYGELHKDDKDRKLEVI